MLMQYSWKRFSFVLPQCPDKPDFARHLPKSIGQCASAEQKIGAIILYKVPFSDMSHTLLEL